MFDDNGKFVGNKIVLIKAIRSISSALGEQFDLARAKKMADQIFGLDIYLNRLIEHIQKHMS